MNEACSTGRIIAATTKLPEEGHHAEGVPPPWFHMVRYHGVLAPNAKLRSEVVPNPPSDAELATHTSGPQLELELERFGPTTSRPPMRKPWAWLLRHVFAEDLVTCVRCRGPMRWLEVATTPERIADLLARHDLGPPPRSPPRARRLPRGQLDLRFA